MFVVCCFLKRKGKKNDFQFCIEKLKNRSKEMKRGEGKGEVDE